MSPKIHQEVLHNSVLKMSFAEVCTGFTLIVVDSDYLPKPFRDGPLFFMVGGGGGYHFWELQTIFSKE